MSQRITRRSYTELAPGIWSDPISERRNDFDGAQAGYEAALAQTKSIVDAISGGSGQSVDALWDAALDIAAHIAESCETETGGEPISASGMRILIARRIRSMKKDR